MYDSTLQFSTDQDLAQVVGSYLSDKSIDMWNGARQTTALGHTPVLDPGRGNLIQVVCHVTEAFSTGSSPTVLVELIMADDAGLTSGVTSLKQAPGGSITVGIPAATLIAGYEFSIGALPPGVSKRYLGLRYNIFTATTTAGKINAYLNLQRRALGLR